jgi:hypothetical protein
LQEHAVGDGQGVEEQNRRRFWRSERGCDSRRHEPRPSYSCHLACCRPPARGVAAEAEFRAVGGDQSCSGRNRPGIFQLARGYDAYARATWTCSKSTGSTAIPASRMKSSKVLLDLNPLASESPIQAWARSAASPRQAGIAGSVGATAFGQGEQR